MRKTPNRDYYRAKVNAALADSNAKLATIERAAALEQAYDDMEQTIADWDSEGKPTHKLRSVLRYARAKQIYPYFAWEYVYPHGA